MPRIFTCPHCAKKLKTPDGSEGRRIHCPACEAPLLVTEDGLAPAEEEEEEVRLRKVRPAPRAEQEEPPRPARRRRQEDDRPRRRGRQRQGCLPLWVWLVGGGTLVVVAAGVAAVVLVVVLGGNRLSNSPSGPPGQQGPRPVGQDNAGDADSAQVRNGMTEKQVIDLLGEPIFQDIGPSGAGKMIWDKGPIQIEVQFSAGKVVAKKVRHGTPLPGGGWDYKG